MKRSRFSAEAIWFLIIFILSLAYLDWKEYEPENKYWRPDYWQDRRSNTAWRNFNLKYSTNPIVGMLFDKSNAMITWTKKGVYRSTNHGGNWSSIIDNTEFGIIVKVTQAEDGNLIIHTTGSGVKVTANGEVIKKFNKPVETPFIEHLGKLFYVTKQSLEISSDWENWESKPFPELNGGGEIYSDGNNLFTTDNDYLYVMENNEGKKIDKFNFSNPNRLERKVLFDTNGNLYVDAYRSQPGNGKIKSPYVLIVKINPERKESKILNFELTKPTPRTLELVGIIDNNIFFRVNGTILYISPDGGKTAQRIGLSFSHEGEDDFGDITSIHKGADKALYASRFDAIYRSIDNGVNWVSLGRNGIPIGEPGQPMYF